MLPERNENFQDQPKLYFTTTMSRKNNLRKDRYCKDVLKDSLQNLSVSGLRYAAGHSEPLLRRAIWSVLIVGGLVFMNYQIVRSVQLYWSRPVAVTIDEIYPESLRFPVVTICNENSMARSKVRQYGVETEVGKLYDITKKVNNFTSIEAKLNATYQNYGFTSYLQLRKAFAHNTSDMLLFCVYSTEWCQQTLIREVWTDMGLCMQFNGAGQDFRITNADSWQGLDLWLDTHQSEYISTLGGGAGYRVLATDLGEIPLMSQHGIRISPGTITSLKIKQTQTRLLQPPYGNCTMQRHLKRYKTYTKRNCNLECYAEYFKSVCGCLSYHMPHLPDERTCSLIEERICWMETYVSFNGHASTNCKCRPSCSSTTYSLFTSSNPLSKHYANLLSDVSLFANYSVSDIMDNLVSVNLYFPSMSYTKVKSHVAYKLTMLFNDLGGALGLMLGSTFFTVYEIFDILIWAGWARCREKRSKDGVKT